MFLLVPAYPGSPGQKAVKRLCVCVCYALANCVICITAVERLSLLDWQFYEVIGKLMFLWR